MSLAKHTQINRQHFRPGSRMTRRQWVRLIERDVVKGAVIDGKPFIDEEWFVANKSMVGAPAPEKRASKTALELLRGGRKK